MVFQPPSNAEAIVHELSNELMSPYCPARTISSCPSSQARKLEDVILEEAKMGKSKEQIEAALEAQFGSATLGTNESPAVLWITGFGVIVAVLLVMRLVRRRSETETGTDVPRDTPSAGSSTANATDSEAAQLEDDLDEVEDF